MRRLIELTQEEARQAIVDFVRAKYSASVEVTSWPVHVPHPFNVRKVGQPEDVLCGVRIEIKPESKA